MGAEQLLVRHVELGQEIQEHYLRAQDVQQEGQWLVDSGHLMSPEVRAQRGWNPTTQGLGTPSRNRSPQVKAGKEQRGREGKGRAWAFLGALCWELQAGPASVLLIEHLTQCTLSHQVIACLQELDGRLRALREACTLRQERLSRLSPEPLPGPSRHSPGFRSGKPSGAAGLQGRAGHGPPRPSWEGPREDLNAGACAILARTGSGRAGPPQGPEQGCPSSPTDTPDQDHPGFPAP